VALQPQPRRRSRFDPRPGRRRACPAGARVRPGVARRDGAAVLADCSSLKGKLSVWLVLRLFSMERTVDDLSGCG
jgi:hypothetical protein